MTILKTYSPPRVLVLGSRGLLGSTLVPYLISQNIEVVILRAYGVDGGRIELSNQESMVLNLDMMKPQVIVNLVAKTDVEACEALPNAAYESNVKVVENIANWILKGDNKCHLIHISTDHFYEGSLLNLESHVELKNYYAFSKYAGELAAQSVPHTIIRTNFFGLSRKSCRKSFTDWLYDALKSQELINVFEDVHFSPISILRLCEVIELFIKKRTIGTFNVGSHLGMSKADFAFQFSDALRLGSNNMKRTSSSCLESGVQRPKDMRMDCSKFEQVMNYALPELRNEILDIAREYENARSK